MLCLWEAQRRTIPGSPWAREICNQHPLLPADVSTFLMAKWRFLLCCFSLSRSPCTRQCTYLIFSIHRKIPFCFWNIQFSQPFLPSFCWGHTVLQDYNLCSSAESDSSDTKMCETAESKGNYEQLSQNEKSELKEEFVFIILSKQDMCVSMIWAFTDVEATLTSKSDSTSVWLQD